MFAKQRGFQYGIPTHTNAPGLFGCEIAATTSALSRSSLDKARSSPSTRASLTSAIVAYMRALGRELERRRRKHAAASSPSPHVGAVGDRLDLELVIERVAERPSDWGAMNILVMRDATGWLFVWKTGAAGGTPGDQIKLLGSIKKHSEFRGEKQTELTRCKIGERVLAS